MNIEHTTTLTLMNENERESLKQCLMIASIALSESLRSGSTRGVVGTVGITDLREANLLQQFASNLEERI